ncbi:hypothetical protein P879_03001 [Paragonimus westermani]|uniref:FMRFamide-activated amiloride-sensitive sodium channel n=1 Tax=Paragonimus westermani TaxID=34504 RepID=A0A8T0DFM4_9TREM|nr:hypothetical protein P879_03001 [Paragonimus westermani]
MPEDKRPNIRPGRRSDSQIVKNVIENGSLFLESISIRGCNRIVRAQSLFIRLLWICFLILTTVFLFISVKRIVGEYLLYTINIEAEEEMDAPAPFPSVTFCNHQPFSERAYTLWKAGKVLSPSKFSQILRQKADSLIRESNLKNETFPLHAVAHFGIVFDSIKLYYQNLDWPDHLLLGHQRNHSIYMCLMRFSGGSLALGGPGCYDSMIHITQFSHPHHFNCYTVAISQNISQTVEELGLIIWLGPPENFDIQYRQAFLQDVFEQAHGLRVTIHEPQQLAKLDQSGIQIEPGRMNEINFEVVKKEHVETPRKPCVRNPTQTYRDLENTYQYEFELCLQNHLQLVVVQQCGCLYAYLPRIAMPTLELPYCGRILKNDSLDETEFLFARKLCVFNLIKQFATMRKRLENHGKCLHRCTTVDYDNRVSVTTWRATQWQLYWSKVTAAALEQIDSQMPNPSAESVEKFQTYFRTANLSETVTSSPDLPESITGKYGFSDRHTYLLIKRKRNDTLARKEVQVLTFEALISRIGGLCSLYIGMTFAIFIEIIEFFYLVYSRHGSVQRDIEPINNGVNTAQNGGVNEQPRLPVENEMLCSAERLEITGNAATFSTETKKS